METRTIETEIKDIKILLEKADLDQKIKSQLKNKLAEIKKLSKECFIDPVSFEYFSFDDQPFTILTSSNIKTVVTKSTKNTLQAKHNTETLKAEKAGQSYIPLDPITRLPIIGYIKNNEVLALLQSTYESLKHLEEKIRLSHLAYTEDEKKVFTLKITMPNSQEALTLADKMQNEMKLPIKIKDRTITILPANEIGPCGTYSYPAELGSEIFCIAFPNNGYRDEFAEIMRLTHSNAVTMLHFESQTNIIYFKQESLIKVLETRTIEDEIEDVETSLKKASLPQGIEHLFKKELEEIKKLSDERLICPISFEYFSPDNPPYTILTDGIIKTVVTESAKNKLVAMYASEIEKANATFELTGEMIPYVPFDPVTRLPIKGYQKNQDVLPLLQSTKDSLKHLENKIKMGHFAYTEITNKVFTLQITLPNSVDALALANKMQNEWKLPIEIKGSTITILPSSGIGTCGTYPSKNEKKQEIAIAFEDQKYRDEFVTTFNIPTTKSIFKPGWGQQIIGKGTNAIYFEREFLIETQPPQASIVQSPFTLYSSIKPPQAEPKILLSNLMLKGKEMLAVKFPDEATAVTCLERLKVGEYKGLTVPSISDDHPNTLFFPTYIAAGGEFTAIFPSSKMCETFFDLIIADVDKVRTKAFQRQNRAGDFVIHFCDKALLAENGNIRLSISNELKGKENISLSMTNLNI